MKNRITNFYFILFVSLFINSSLFAQDTEDNKDFESWNSVVIKYKATKKLSFALEQQIRFNDNVSETDQYFTQLEAGYKILKKLELGGELRYINKNDNKGKIQGYENHLRYQFNVSYKHKIDDFSFKYKLAYQNKVELKVATDDDDIAKENIRLKAGFGYNIKKWPLDPKVSTEIFNTIGGDDSEAKGFSKFRFTIGTEYKIKKIGEVSIFYRYEDELNVDNPFSSDILGLKFTYTIKD